MTTNQLKFKELEENRRHNITTEELSRDKQAKDYDVGSRQATASLAQAAASQKQADVADINAATRQAELSWEVSKYYDTGRDKVSAETDLTKNKAATESHETTKRGVEAFVAEKTVGNQIIKSGNEAVLSSYKANPVMYTIEALFPRGLVSPVGAGAKGIK